MSALLDAALAYAGRGWPVFPCQPGSKQPAGRLVPHGVLDATTDEARIRAWWTAIPSANIGIATGHPGPDVVDVDVKPEGNGWEAFAEIVRAKLADGGAAYVATPSGGLHVYYEGSSQRNGRIPGRHIDFRGHGGYVIAPPSHVGDRPYTHRGDMATTGQLADWAAIRALLDPPPDPPAFRQPAHEPASPAARHTGRPGDDWATRTTWAQLLQPHGWQRTRDLGGGRAMWRRPGKQEGSSATTRDDGGLYVFTTSTEFEPEVPYTKFGALAVLEHDGDHTAAAAALRLAGYGEPAGTLPAIPAQPQAAVPPGPEETDGGEPASTSWRPVDLGPILDGDISGDPPPVLLTRDDGKPLLYAGKINALIGESESGKTWIALLAAAQALTAGHRVIYLDFEDSPGGIVTRLLALGAEPGQILSQLAYIAPDEPLGVLAAADLAAVLAAGTAPGLIVVDGVNAAMTMLGLNLTDNKDATSFSQRVLRPLKRTGAAVLTVDHVTKDKETRGNYAIGAQAKRADIDGAAILVEATQKFGRGQQGKLKLTISKDRPGHVRAMSAGATHAGTAILTSRGNGTITAEITAPDLRPASEKPKWRPTGFMEKISRFLEECTDGASTRVIRSEIKGDNNHIDAALDRLTEGGWISRHPGSRGAVTHRSEHPYREVTEHQNLTVLDRAGTVLTENPAQSSGQPSDRAENPYTRTKSGRGSSTVAPTAPGSTVRPPTVLQHTSTPCTGCGEPQHPTRACFTAGAAL